MLGLIIHAHCLKTFLIHKCRQLFFTVENFGGVDLPLKDSDPYEYIHLIFIKRNLGVHYESIYAACRLLTFTIYRPN